MINILKYLLFVEYLNPRELKKLYKSKDKFIDDIQFTKINDFISNNIQKAINKALNKKDIKKDELKASIRIFGGFFNTKLINDTLDKICDNKLDKYEDIEHKNCASFMCEFNGRLRLKKDDEILDFINYQNDDFLDIVIDDFFNLDLNSFGISTVPWALNNIKNLTNIKYEEFLQLTDDIKCKIATIKQDNLIDFYKHLIRIINDFIPIDGENLRIELIVYKDTKSNEPFLNSFYIKDILKLLEKYEANQNDELLDKYFGFVKNENKFDLRDEKNTLSAFENYINNMSLSAFPSTYALMFSQQFAVNEILKRFDKQKGEFYSVNGPPGTGKTTLLKDIIAGVITQRAIEISKLGENDIFSLSTKNGINCLNPNLVGYEMIVASSNNGAVENVSKEIPEISSIDKKYFEKTDYFKEIATRILSNNYENDNKGWGLISAALGKSSHLSSFRYTALNKTKRPKCNVDKTYLDKNAYNINGLMEYVKSNEANFNAAKNEFKKAYDKVQKLLDENLKEQKENIKKINNAKSLQEKLSKYDEIKMQNLQQIIDELKEKRKIKITENEVLQKEINKFKDDIKEQEARKNNIKNPTPPFFLHALFKTRVYKLYLQEKENFNKEYQKYIKIIDDLDNSCKNIQSKIDNNNPFELENKINKLNKELNEYLHEKSQLEMDKNNVDCANKFIYDTFLNDEIKKEKSSFFMSENGQKTELFEARVELFLKALDLHKAAILSNGDYFAKNLSELGRVFNKDYSSKLNNNDMLNLWQTLFFIVPVISSTYASFSTCFKDIGQNELGILLSDESGQAAITNPIGALFRVKNAVVVGDPLQLEPVATISNNINNKLLELFGVDNEFSIKASSMQTRVDKTEKYGTYIKQNGAKIWLGSPLRVHNRCDNPMFDVANKIAYDSMMIWGKDKNKDSLGLKSTWIDIQDEEWSGNCNLAEIRALEKLLNKLSNHHENIGIISPFSDNSKQIKDLVDKNYKKISKSKVGTIHTMQGKEAKIIILVLGGSSDGARNWAASKPNLLNVALTRAKEYIYIIGNKEKYLKLPYFEELTAL